MDWITAPVYRALLSRQTMMGLPKQLAMALGVLTMTMVVGFGQVWFLVFTVALYVAGRMFAKQDEYFFELALRALKMPDRVD